MIGTVCSPRLSESTTNAVRELGALMVPAPLRRLSSLLGPSLVAVVALSLSLGVGATTLSLIYRLISSPIPVTEISELYAVERIDRRRPNVPLILHSPELYEAIRAAPTFSS